MMAIRILLDHDVREENIILVSLLMAETGVHRLAYAFPNVTLVTTAVDPHISEQYYVIPGMGNFGDRYFGTEAVGTALTDDELENAEDDVYGGNEPKTMKYPKSPSNSTSSSSDCDEERSGVEPELDDDSTTIF